MDPYAFETTPFEFFKAREGDRLRMETGASYTNWQDDRRQLVLGPVREDIYLIRIENHTRSRLSPYTYV